jgi:hypothetical protein
MDLQMVLDWLVQKLPVLPLILGVLGSLVVVATALVAVTPNQDDDALLAKIKAIPVLGSILVALEKFSVIQRKPPQA